MMGKTHNMHKDAMELRDEILTQKQNEMKDLTKILKDGDEVYYTPTGEMHKVRIDRDDDNYPIVLLNIYIDGALTKHGELTEGGECLIFPSKEERNWDNFKREEFKKGDLCAFWNDNNEGKYLRLFYRYTADKKGYINISRMSKGDMQEGLAWKYCEKINIEDYI